MGRPKVHDEATRATLLSAAERLAEEEGLDAVSLRRLAAQTELSTRAVYSTFGSKDAIVDALGARAFDWLLDEIERFPTTGDAVEDLIELAVRVFRRLAIEHTAIFKLGFALETRDGANPQTAAAAERALEPLIRALSRVVTHPAQVRDAVLGFDAICEGLAMLELRGNFDTDRDPEMAWRSTLSTFVAGVQRQRHGSTRSVRDRDASQ